MAAKSNVRDRDVRIGRRLTVFLEESRALVDPAAVLPTGMGDGIDSSCGIRSRRSTRDVSPRRSSRGALLRLRHDWILRISRLARDERSRRIEVGQGLDLEHAVARLEDEVGPALLARHAPRPAVLVTRARRQHAGAVISRFPDDTTEA